MLKSALKVHSWSLQTFKINIWQEASPKQQLDYTGWGKSRVTVVSMEKDKQIMVITKALLTPCFGYSQL